VSGVGNSNADLTGCDQFSRNIVVGWGMQLFVLAVGFIVPRHINDNLGPDLLGIWDLGWATVNYLSITNFGVGTAVTRYGAMYRAQADFQALSRAATSATIWQMGVAAITAIASMIFALAAKYWVDIPESISTQDVQLTLFLLGLTLSANTASNSASAILAAYHRWDINYTINGFDTVLQGAGILFVLLMGGGLVEMASMVLANSIVISATRIFFARREAVEIVIKWEHWESKSAKKMLLFGGKSLITTLPELLLFQTLSMLIAGFAGPAVLAHLSRGIALVRQASIMIRRMSRMFLPMTGGLLGLNRREETLALILDAGKYGAAFTLPIVIIFICFGDLILKLWMGEGFDNWLMMTMLSLGMFFPFTFTPVSSVLTGLNAHGKIAVYNLIATVAGFLVASWVVTVFYEWNVVTASMVIAIVWPFGNALIIPLFIKYRFKISLLRFFYRVVAIPIFCCLPMLILMPLARILLVEESSWTGFILCFVIAGALQIISYYKWILSGYGKQQLKKMLYKLTSRFTRDVA